MIELFAAAIGVAVIHSLAPDHYVPFAAIGNARRWSAAKTLAFAALAATIHVSLSAAIALALVCGIDLLSLAEFFEGYASLLLIAAGFGYAVLSLFRKHSHHHAFSAGVLAAVSLSPCIPLVPIAVAAADVGAAAVISAAFATATIATCVAMTYAAMKAVRPPRFMHGREEVFAGLAVGLAGIVAAIVDLVAKQRGAEA